MSAMTMVGLAIVSTWRIRVGARGERRLDGVDVGGVHVARRPTPSRPNDVDAAWVRVVP